MDPSNSGSESSSTPENLFQVDEECEKLSIAKAKGFHNLVAKTLYVGIYCQLIPDWIKSTRAQIFSCQIQNGDTEQVESQIDSNTIYYFEFQTWNLALQPA